MTFFQTSISSQAEKLERAVESRQVCQEIQLMTSNQENPT